MVIMDDPRLQAYLASLSPHEAAQVKKRLDDLRGDCGCSVGAVVMLGVTTSWIIHALLVPTAGRSWQRTTATGFGVLMASALIGKLMGYRGRFTWDTSKPNGQPRRCLDVSRAQREFGFRARTDFEAGLRQTVEWWVAQAEPQRERASAAS